MEKIFKILIVFALLILVIGYSFKARERRYNDYFFSRRLRYPLPVHNDRELLASFNGLPLAQPPDALLFDPASHLLYCYSTEGSLTIFKVISEGEYKEMQVLSVPRDCTGLSLDTVKDELYLHADEEVFIFSK